MKRNGVWVGDLAEREEYRNAMFNILSKLSLPIFGFMMIGCSQPTYHVPIAELGQPPTEKIVTHRVERGDTLYGIARRYDVPLAALLHSNDLELFDTIVPGQVIFLDQRKPSLKTVSKTSAFGVKVYKAPVTSVKPTLTKKATSPSPKLAKQTPKPVAKPKPSSAPTRSKPLPPPRVKPRPSRPMIASSTKKGGWQWPLDGRLTYQKSHLSGAQTGIEIQGGNGDSVLSVAAGEVVYAGEGLRGGHGKLVIVKHSERYLSAYSQVSDLQVKERQRVKKGQVIAKLIHLGAYRSKGASSPKAKEKKQAALYFEIRDNGKAIDPARLLPKRS